MSGYALDASVAVAALTEPDGPATELPAGEDITARRSAAPSRSSSGKRRMCA